MVTCSPRYGQRRGGGDGGMGAAEQQVQDGHPGGDAVGDLLDGRAAVGVGDLGGDLHAAVHRAGVHHDGVLGHLRHAVAVEPVPAGVLALGREEGRVHAFALHTQHHHRIGLRQHVVEVVRDLAGPGLDADRDERGRGHQGDLGAEGVQQVDVGAGHAAVQDVADDGDPAAVQVLAEAGVAADQAAAHGEGVQQGLGGVLVGAVAGVDDGGVDPAGGREPVGGAGGVVADDDRVGAHGLQGQRGVLQGFALGNGRTLRGEVDDVGREPLGGRLEGDPGAGRVLEEEVDDGEPAQGGQLLDRPVRDTGHLLGGVEDQDGVVAREVGGRDEVTLHLDGSVGREGRRADGQGASGQGRPRRGPGRGPSLERSTDLLPGRSAGRAARRHGRPPPGAGP